MMPRTVAVAVLISVPCLLALVAYDSVAVFLLRRGEYRLVPAHDVARGFLQDVGLVLVYALTITPRVMPIMSDRPIHTARPALVMLGLGIAWYDVLCAFLTRMLPEPPGMALGLVALFVIPVLLAPCYLRWLQSKVHTA
jgi:hypothetical protein